MEKILITGASGFLGSRIANFYSEKYDIIAPTHGEMDITNEKSVMSAFETWKPDIVIHCAAISDVGLCEREPERSWKINVDGSIHMAKASERFHAKCILCSSDQVYFGSMEKGAHKEEEKLAPCNIYGREKLKAEQECLQVNADCVLLRLSWLYDLKTIKEGEHGDFFRSLLSKIKNREELCYPVYDKRGISDVNEVIRNLEKTFEITGGIYNFGSPNDKDTFHTVCEVFDNIGLDTKNIQKNEEAFKDNPRNITMSQEKLMGCGINFSTTVGNLSRSLEKMLQESV